MDFSQVILYFTVYSILGWAVETIVCSVLAKRFTNRGVLGGPFCPMYGFAAVIALMLMEIPGVRSIPLLVFILCALVLTALKFLTSWLLEKLLGLRLWNQARWKLNIKGRVYWLDLVLFGFFGSVVVYLLQPLVVKGVLLLASSQQRVLASVLIGVFAFETYRALSCMARLGALLKTIQANGCTLPEDARKPEGLYAACFRFINAYPRLEVMGFDDALECLHLAWDTSRKGFKERMRSLAGIFGHKTAQTVKGMNPFAHGVSFYKLVWIFAVGCVLGYLIETAFCLVTRGVIESRQGMVYGPFNQVYGMGAVLMTLLLEPLAKKGDGWLFLGGALVGGAFEFVASWLQESVLGTVSWEYSEQAFSVGGRTSLMFMFFWGVLGVVYIRKVYPRISGLIERIPRRQGAFFSWVIIVVLTLNMAISLVAVNRWIERQKGVEATNGYETFLDTHYPDAMMEEIYPSMMVVGEDGTRPKREM